MAGCGDGTGPERGSFQATVTGDLSLSLSGDAVFGPQTQGGQTAFAIGLLDGDPSAPPYNAVVISRDNVAAPAAGTYGIEAGFCADCTPDDFVGGFVHLITQLDVATFLSDTGSFTLTTVTADRVEGTFRFTATAFLVVGEVNADSVRIEGSFTAVPGEIPGIAQ